MDTYRVGAIQSADRTTVKLYGYGYYCGEERHPKTGILNTKIVLDNGNIIWGSECWWMPEEETKTFFGTRTVQVVEKQKLKKYIAFKK